MSGMSKYSRVPIDTLLNTSNEPRPRAKLARLPLLPGIAELLSPATGNTPRSGGTTLTEYKAPAFPNQPHQHLISPQTAHTSFLPVRLTPLGNHSRRETNNDLLPPLQPRESAVGEEDEVKEIKTPRTPGPSRRRWTADEDRLVIELVNKHGPSKWDAIAAQLPGRSAQHVRLRYTNYLRAHSREGQEFDHEEDARILHEGSSGARKWARLAKELGRSHCSVKNRFQMLQRKAAKKDTN